MTCSQSNRRKSLHDAMSSVPCRGPGSRQIWPRRHAAGSMDMTRATAFRYFTCLCVTGCASHCLFSYQTSINVPEVYKDKSITIEVYVRLKTSLGDHPTMSWVLGHMSTTFHSATNTIDIPLKQKEDGRHRNTSKSFRDLCEETTPACTLNPLLPGGHLQTMYTALRSYDIPITYKRKIFDSNCANYPGTFAVDFVVPTTSPAPAVDQDLPPRTTFYDDDGFEALGSDDEKPMLIVLHGLSGGSHEIYLRSVLKPLCLDPPESERWEACVVNARGCAMSKITSGVLYNARATWDIRQFAQFAREKWPQRKIFACGFSLGANILVNVCTNLNSKYASPDHGLDLTSDRSNSISEKRAQNAHWMLLLSYQIHGTSTFRTPCSSPAG